MQPLASQPGPLLREPTKLGTATAATSPMMNTRMANDQNPMGQDQFDFSRSLMFLNEHRWLNFVLI